MPQYIVAYQIGGITGKVIQFSQRSSNIERRFTLKSFIFEYGTHSKDFTVFIGFQIQATVEGVVFCPIQLRSVTIDCGNCSEFSTVDLKEL
jgi:hypothetical protein